LKADPPGERFQRQFKRRREAGRTPLQKTLYIGGGILLIAVGVLFFFFPGPGLPIVLLGAVLIAQQSLTAARILDRTEVRLRKLLARSVKTWRSFSATVKIVLVALALLAAAAVGFGAFKFLIA